jgi:DNA-directed RNA polymerase subunit RPC12/RpoP
MIDTVLNLLFRCSHRRITRPITPVIKTGEAHHGAYVVCLDCGKQFAYDTSEMKIGKPIDRSDTIGVLPSNMPRPRKTMIGYALLAAAPVAVLFGVAMKGRNHKKPVSPETRQPASPELKETTRP